jgi:hypothetical protein
MFDYAERIFFATAYVVGLPVLSRGVSAQSLDFSHDAASLLPNWKPAVSQPVPLR